MTQSPLTHRSAKLPIREILGIDIPAIEICDVGAMLEGTERYANLVAQNLANVSGFEPNAVEFEKLRAQNKPRRRYFPNFLGKGGAGTFHITRYPGCSSLYEPDPAAIDLFTSIGATLPAGNFAVIKTEAVQTTQLDDVPNLPAPDYMKIDVQGAELDVLHGASRALAQTLVIEAEVEFIPLYNQPLFGDVQMFLAGHNFLLHKFIDVSGRAFRPVQLGPNPYVAMSQLLWADAIFVRDFTKLELYSDEQLLRASAILYEAYNSHDLVLHLLRGYDQRRGTQLVPRFTEAIAMIRPLPLTYMNQKVDP